MKKLFKLNAKVHGQGYVVFAWQPQGAFLASSGKNGLVHIFDRQGEEYDEVGLDINAPVLDLQWDPEGATLAVLQRGSDVIPLWDLGRRSLQNLDVNMKDPTFIRWNTSGELLAIGTQKGNLVVYNKISRKIVPVLGKHSKRISCGAWNISDKLVLGGDDKLMTLSDSKGDTIDQRELTTSPLNIKFGRTRGDSMQLGEQIIVINLTKSLVMYDMKDPENPVELSFQTHYGSAVFFDWFADGMLMVAFSEGYLIIISTKISEIGEEIFSTKCFSERIYAATYSPNLNRIALAGNGGIKVIDMSARKEVTSDMIKSSDLESTEASHLEFTKDGQILSIATAEGTLHNFLAQMPQIYDYYNTYVAFLSSLREITIVDVLEREKPLRITVSIEPAFVSIGPRHVAVGMNNRVWFYRCDGSSKDTLVNEQQYLGNVMSVKLNRDYAAVLYDGKVNLHLIEQGNGNSQAEQGKTFSSTSSGRDERKSEVSSIALTKDFLIYSTGGSTGTIHFFYMADWTPIEACGYRHEQGVGIVKIAPNQYGTRIVFLDSHRRGYVLNVPTKDLVHVPNLPTGTMKVLWDVADQTVFSAFQQTEFSVFLYNDTTVHGPEATQLGLMEIHENGDFIMVPETTPIPSDLSPILLHDGILTCQHASGKLSTLTSCTHEQLHQSERSFTAMETNKSVFRQNLSLYRLTSAWDLAMTLNIRDYWLALAGRAMHALDISLAKRVYRQLGDAGMVLGLDRIEGIEEKTLLAGHVAMLFGDYTTARRLFLDSSDPMAALQMQKHLLQWDQALNLADSLSPDLVPELSVAYATQLEFRGDFSGALKMYENATGATDEGGNVVVCSDKLQRQSLAGIARCTFRLGDVRQGMKVMADVTDMTVYKECANILEGMKQLVDAAILFEMGQQYEKAAQIYIQTKSLNKAEPLMSKVTTPKIHAQFGRAKEAAGDFDAASNAYEAANDMDNVVRIQLENLQNPEKAFSIVRKTKSSEGAMVVAKYCVESGNYKGAIEFLLMANKESEAFQLALTHSEMDTFASVLGDRISVERAVAMAQYYEQARQAQRAAEFYQICGHYHKALRLFLQCGDSELDRAIDVVGKARNDMLTHTLIDYLMGEADGIPKDPNYIFRLYMALGNFAQAAKTALIISKQEQELGNYKVARDVLSSTYRQLQLHRIHVDQELSHSLMLLHSYILVKKLVKVGDHTAASYMLGRIVKHISKFPTHATNILISAVIECQRAGLKAYSYEHATVLMRPEHRTTMDKDIRRKIEAIVRRPNKEQGPDEQTPCPFCHSDLPNADLNCSQCKNWVPYCVATGYHMIKEDWCTCPNCASPALYTRFVKMLEVDPTCPMCDQEVSSTELQLTSEDQVNALLTPSSDEQKQ